MLKRCRASDVDATLEGGGRHDDDKQYHLKNALKPQQSFSSEAASRNQICSLLGAHSGARRRLCF